MFDGIKKARAFDSGFKFFLIIYYLTNFFKDGENLVKLIPFTAALYSSIVGVLPNIVERTTTGVDESNDSPFFPSVSPTTLPWKRRVEVAITVSPGAAFS